MAAARMLADDNLDALDAWADGLSHRLTLQAEVTWPALQDGYAAGGASDPAAPFAHLWWELGAVKTEHCADCPWLAYNSPYDAPGSGGNELAQTPGDGRTDCGAGCKCSLSYGGWLPGEDADWATWFFPPDAPMKNPPANPGLVPETVQPWQTPVPVAIDREGNYVYPDTPEEARLRVERAARLHVEAIPVDQAELTASQKAALDDFRSAWRKWDRVRGDRPAARSLFGYVWNEQTQAFQVSQSAATLVPRTSGLQIQDEAFARSWADLTPGQQRALVALWYAIVAWDAAVAPAAEPQTQLAESAEPEAAATTITLTGGGHEPGYDEQGHDARTGHWLPGHGPQVTSSSSSALGTQHEHAGAILAARRAEHEQITTVRLPHVEREITRYRGWLDTHESTHPQYGDVAKYHEKLLDTRGALTARAASLAEEITAREHALTHQFDPTPKGDPLTEAGREVLTLNGHIATAQRHLDAERDPVKRAQLAAELAGLQDRRQQAMERARPAAIVRQREHVRRSTQKRLETHPEFADAQRAASRATYAKLKADPEKLARKRAQSRESMRRLYERKRAEKQQQQQQPEALTERDAQVTVALMGGHPQGYEQNRDNKGRWAPGDSGALEWRNEPTRAHVMKNAGRDLGDEEVAHLAGARAAASVRVGAGGHIFVEHPDGYRHSAVIVRDSETGKPYVYNNDFSVGKLNERGIGDTSVPFDARVLATQVMAARRAGIETIAMKSRAGSRDAQELPRLGFDTPTERIFHETRGGMLAVPSHIRQMKMLSDVLQSAEGRKWWDEQGMNPLMEFDTRATSRHSQILDAYLRGQYGRGLEEF